MKIKTINPPKKTYGDTVKPFSVTPNIAPPPQIVEPIHGPINIGTNTDAKILNPWNKPTLSSGVYFRITVLNEAVADRNPIIINRKPKKVAISPLKKVKIIKPIE